MQPRYDPVLWHDRTLTREEYFRLRDAPAPTSTPVDAQRAFLAAVRRPDWTRRAACRGMGHSCFIPAVSREDVKGEIAGAREVCGRCPVTDECLAYALEHQELVGVWAGSTVAQRKVMRRTRRQLPRTA